MVRAGLQKKKMRITQKEFEMLTRAFMEFFRKKKQHFIHLNICHFLCLSPLKRFFFRVFRLLFWRRASHAKKLYAFSAVDTAWWKNKRKEQVVGNFLAFHYDVRFDNMKIVYPVDLNEQMPQCRVRSFIATLFFFMAPFVLSSAYALFQLTFRQLQSGSTRTLYDNHLLDLFMTDFCVRLEKMTQNSIQSNLMSWLLTSKDAE